MGASTGIFVAGTCVAIWTAGLAAQDSIPAGTRVRLLIKAPRISPVALDTHTVAVEGRAVAVDGATLVVARKSPADTMGVPLVQIVRLEVQTRPSHKTRGALIGGAVGATLGLIIIVDESRNSRADCGELCGAQYFAAGLLTVSGAYLGAALRRAHWRRISISGIRVTEAFVGSRGATVTLSVPF